MEFLKSFLSNFFSLDFLKSFYSRELVFFVLIVLALRVAKWWATFKKKV